MQFKTISPIDGSVYCERQHATGKQIAKALNDAQDAQRAWRNTQLKERIAICQIAVDFFKQHADEIGKEITHMMGRPIRYTPFEITKGFVERAEYMISIAEENLVDIKVPEKKGFVRYISREPLGTVLVLAPWNYPYLTSVNVIIPALLAGNCVILKHAEQTPLCAERYAQAFAAAGLPEGVFQYLHMSHDQVAATIQDTGIDYVAFTGSVAGGRAVQQAANNRFIGAGMELGGKDPAYVREDAVLESAVENIVDGAFFNSGQSCCGIERVYVHESLFKDFVEAAVSLTKDYQLGDPLDTNTTLGPMVRASAAANAQAHIDEALQKGARALIDSSHFPAHQSGSAYMAPQILIGVSNRMKIMSEETFAPVVGIVSVADDVEALRLMNESQYGLTASIWTKDLEFAKQMGNELQTGTVFMNRCDYLDPALAWTGVKNSGRGCTLSALGYAGLTRPKSFHLRM